VIVSHSARLAEGVVELAQGMVGASVPLVAAGGLDLPDAPLGTDVAKIVQAIEEVAHNEGVLILVDLGSAILNAEMAREMIDPELFDKILICEAPLVEGAVAAAVQAKLGSSLTKVAQEARGALLGKQMQLGSAEVPPTPIATLPTTALVLQVEVTNPLGLHARPAARLVQTLQRFQAEVTLTNLTTQRGPIDARSINRVTTLGIRQNHTIEFAASGQDAAGVLAALRQLAANNFGDAPLAPTTQATPLPPTIAREGEWVGIAASPGIAIGTVQTVQPVEWNVPTTTTATPQVEWARLLTALQQTRVDLQATLQRMQRQADAQSAAIFEAHLLFLEDAALREPAQPGIEQDHLNAAAAWQRAYQLLAAQYEQLEDDYLRSRAKDVLDVGRQVLAHLLGQTAPTLQLTTAGILIAPDLTPAETAHLDIKLVQGIATAFGSTTSHSAILARALGIPAVVGLGAAVLKLASNTPLILDGTRGVIVVNAAANMIETYRQQQLAAQTAAEEAYSTSAAPAITQDGQRVEIAANIGSLEDARQAVAAGAEGVGLFRTEFLFLDRATEPTEEEQYQAYVAVAQTLQDRPLIIRTLDVGGDKPLPYIDVGHEANPFLGLRAIRLCLARPELFKKQLRAIVRVAVLHPVHLMFPMLATLDELQTARHLLTTVKQELQLFPTGMQVGMMVEVPSAAIQAADFAPLVDFFSIGTNDLTQYTMAAERGNAQVNYLSDALQPAVLRLIQQVVAAAEVHGKWVGVCGELAGNPQAVPLLVGLGVRELSMNAQAIPRIKQMIRTLNYAALQTQARTALQLATAAELRAIFP
jgi:phosphocarrier protein FPr